MMRVQTSTCSVVVRIHFTPSLFDWVPVPSRFFRMLHETLPPAFTDDPNRFSVTNGNTLDEVSAKYSILGEADTIVLSAKLLSMEFRDLDRDMLEPVIQLIQDVEAGFVTHFPECGYKKLEVISLEHLSPCDKQSASDYLNRFALSSLDEAFHGFELVNHPSARFTVTDTENTWTANCFVEKSQSLDNGIFLHVRATLLKVNASEHFQEKRDRVNRIVTACARALQLEHDNA